jgi:hypothetical protein
MTGLGDRNWVRLSGHPPPLAPARLGGQIRTSPSICFTGPERFIHQFLILPLMLAPNAVRDIGG